MRLLSNLYKQRFITNESESRVINSNTLAYRILEEQSRALAKTREPEQPQAESGGFVEGIAAPQVETIDYEAEAKEKAEEILSKLGISASSAINMFYKQIILQQGLPFEVKLPSEKITDISQLSEKELNEKLEKAYEDMLKGRTRNAKDVFSDIRKDYGL